MKFNTIPLISLILLVMATTSPALAQPIGKAYVELGGGAVNVFGTWQVPQGQYITVRVKVTISSYSPVPLNGFWLKVIFDKPDGSTIEKWIDFTNEYIGIGQTKYYDVKTGVKADQIGHWFVKVEVWDRYKQKMIFDSLWHGFDVVESLPKGHVDIEDVFGYMSVFGMIVGGLYLLSKIRR